MRIARGKEVYIITAVVAVVLIVAWYFLLFSPTRVKVSELDAEIQSARTALSTAQQDVARLESYKKTAPQSRAQIVRLGKMLPMSEGMPSLIVELTKTTKDSGVDELDSITRSTTTPGRPFGVQTVNLMVTGRFFEIEDFLYRLESYVAFRNSSFRVTGRLLQVTGLGIVGGTAASTTGGVAPLSVAITLNGYLWAGSAAATGAPAAAGGTP